MTLSRLFALGAMLLSVTLITACGSEDTAVESSAAESSAAEPAASSAVEAPVAKELSDAARFDKDIRKQACDILTAERVSDLFGVPAADMMQMRVMGCMYTWDKDGEMLEAKLTLLRAHKSEKSAAQWFQNATRNLTAEEAQAQVDMIMDNVKKKAEEDGLDAGVTGEHALQARRGG